MSAVVTPPVDRIESIRQLLARRNVDLSDNELRRLIKRYKITDAEIQAASQPPGQRSVPPSPAPTTPVNSRLVANLIPVGDEIGQAIAAIIGVGVAFLPEQSITSYQVHLLRFQPVARGNFGRIEAPDAIKLLRGAVSLPHGSSCEVRPSDEIGRPGYIDVTVPRRDRQYILFSAKEVGSRDCSGQPPATIVGKDLYGRNVELPRFIHRAIVGETGGGKSTWIHQDVAIQSVWNSPRHLQFAFIDLARRTFGRFKNYAWNFCAPLIDPDQDKWEDFVRSIMDVYHRRSQLFEHCEDILAWNRQNPDRPESIIMLMVEELGRLNEAFDRAQVDEFLIKIAENGRANGIYLTIAMQRPAADSANGVIHPRVMTNLQTRIAFKCARQTANLVDCPGAVNLLGNGDGLLLHDADWIKFQAYHMGDNKDGIFAGIDAWGRRKYGDRNCYHEPPPEVPPAPDPWEVEAPQRTGPQSHPDWPKYQKYLQHRGADKISTVIRAVFPEARQEKHLNGNTLAKYQRLLDSLIAEFEG
jgi:hypothetical protein